MPAFDVHKDDKANCRLTETKMTATCYQCYIEFTMFNENMPKYRPTHVICNSLVVHVYSTRPSYYILVAISLPYFAFLHVLGDH